MIKNCKKFCQKELNQILCVFVFNGKYLLQDDSRKSATNTYLMEHQPVEYPGAYTVYEMQIPATGGINMAHKTQTLPHPHHHHHHQMHDQRPRARDDQTLGYHSGLSGN